MGKGPLGLRAGSSSNRAGGLVFEAMEPRVLLAATTAAANVFAQFEGVVASGRATVTIPINFQFKHFTFSGGKSVLGVQVVSQSGSTLDAAIVQIKKCAEPERRADFQKRQSAACEGQPRGRQFFGGKIQARGCVGEEHDRRVLRSMFFWAGM